MFTISMYFTNYAFQKRALNTFFSTIVFSYFTSSPTTPLIKHHIYSLTKLFDHFYISFYI